LIERAENNVMKTLKLLTPLKTPELSFKNRVFMAPMTRSRAPERVPTELMKEYYAQRASAGLIFSEATQISLEGVGYISTPGIHTEEQIYEWRKVTDAVHQHGGVIFCQLWHVGRASHPDFHGGKPPVAPSAIPFKGQAFTPEGMKDTVTPRALSLEEIARTITSERQLRRQKSLDLTALRFMGLVGTYPHNFWKMAQTNGQIPTADHWKTALGFSSNRRTQQSVFGEPLGSPRGFGPESHTTG
jgi:N-ethylmaleimide reductase